MGGVDRSVSTILTRLRGRHLALLLALDEERNVHRAAAKIAVTQPAATKLLREIEEMFGAELYERLPRGLAPTQFGRVVTEYARLLVTDLRHLANDLTAVRDGRGGHVSVGAIMAAVPAHVVGATSRLKASHPNFVVKLVTQTSDVLIPLLAQGQLDVVLGRIPDPGFAAQLDFVPLDDERLCVICGPRNALTKSRKLTLAALAGHAWVLQSPPSPMRVLMDRALAAAGKPNAHVAVETSSILASVALVNASDMLSVTPESVATFFSARGLVSVLPVQIAGSLNPYGIVTRRGRWISPSMQLFIDAVRRG